MIAKLKERIQQLHNSTTDIIIKDLCNDALDQYVGINESNVKNYSFIEQGISNALCEKIGNTEDRKANIFIDTEKRLKTLHNLGVKEAITALTEDAAYKQPNVYYNAQKLIEMLNKPEWQTCNAALAILENYTWCPAVSYYVNILKENVQIHSEDINIFNSIASFKNSNTYILNNVSTHIDTYMQERTISNKKKLVESLAPFGFDKNVMQLLESINSSNDSSFNIKNDTRVGVIKANYSPMFIRGDQEYFVVQEKLYVRNGDNITLGTVSEAKELGYGFFNIAKTLMDPKTKIEWNSVTIYNENKKINISGEHIPVLKINEKVTRVEDLYKHFMISSSSNPIAESVVLIMENWDRIVELDFVKTIYSQVNNDRVDAFKLGESIHINIIDTIKGTEQFIQNYNSVQARNAIMERVQYDITESFIDLLSKEEFENRQLEHDQSECLRTIDYLEARVTKIEKSGVTSDELSQVLEFLNNEISKQKDLYYNLKNIDHNNKWKNTTVYESISPLDTVIYDGQTWIVNSITATNKLIIKNKFGDTTTVDITEVSDVKKNVESQPDNDLAIQNQNPVTSVAYKTF
jgi:hypothetical protein